MITKECTGCRNNLPATNDYFNKMKNGKYGLRSKCKSCVKEYGQEYRKIDYVKKRHSEKMALWRKENPERQKEIEKKCRDKNKERYNKERRIKYKTDDNFRKRVKLYEKKYVESGRRYEINNKPEQRKKARIRSKKRRLNSLKNTQDKITQKKWRTENKDLIKRLGYEKIKNLDPSYVACSLRVSVKDLPKEVYETKKIIIKLKRELKNNNVKIR